MLWYEVILMLALCGFIEDLHDIGQLQRGLYTLFDGDSPVTHKREEYN